jgi:hypothetical protein
MKQNVAETYNEEYAPKELKPGLWVNCRRSHRTTNGTVVYEGLMKDGTVFKGTKAQLLRVCSPVGSRSSAAKRQAKPAPLIEAKAKVEVEATVTVKPKPEPAPVLYSAVEIETGKWVAAATTADGGWRALNRKGEVVIGTQADIIANCEPYASKGAATARANKGEAN